MAVQFPLDKLGIIARACTLTGDFVPSVSEDGSDEWNVASAAYEDALADMMEDHSWSWATEIITLVASPTKPADPEFDTAYVIPNDVLHVIWVRQGVGPLQQPALYSVLADQIIVRNLGNLGAVTAKVITSNGADPTLATPKFVRALTMYVMAGIYRGLHEDTAEATKVFAAADAFLQRARTRHDQEQPKRAFYNSRLSMRRRVRGWWPRTPQGWSGTGMPQ